MLGSHDSHSNLGIQTLNTAHSYLSQFQDSQIEPCSGLDKDAYFKSGVPYILARTGSPSQHIPTSVIQQSLDRVGSHSP